MPFESGGEARSEGQASEPHEAPPSVQQGGMFVMEGSDQQPSAADGGGPPEQRPPQPQPPVTPFQQRAMLPPSSSTTDSSPESTLSQRLPTLPGQEGGGSSGSRPSHVVPAGSPRSGRPPLPPAPPRLPSAALLSGASSISIASPFMQQQISSALGSEGSSRWRSNGGFTSTSSSGPPSGAAPPDAAAVAATAAALPAAQGLPLPAAEQAEEDEQAPTPPPEVEQAVWQTHMATVAEEGDEEGEAVPTPLPPRAPPAVQKAAAAAAAPAPQLAKAQPPPTPAVPQAPLQQAGPARPGISDWGPLPDDMARLPPAQQAAVHAAAAGEAALRRQLAPAPAAAAADAEQKQRRRARAAAAAGQPSPSGSPRQLSAGQPPASGSPRQLGAGGSPQAVSPQTVSTKSSSRGGSLSSSGGRSGGSTCRAAAAPLSAGAAQPQEHLLPSVAELPSQALAGEATLAALGQPVQAVPSQAGALPPSTPAQPDTAPAPPPAAAQQSAVGGAALPPSPQAQVPPAPISPQISQLSQISLQPQSLPGYSPGGLSAWQAPLPPPQLGAGGAAPAVPQLGPSLGVPPPGCAPGLASPVQADLLAAQQQLVQLQQAAAAATAAEQRWQEQQQAGAWAAALQQEQEQQQQRQQEQAAAAAALALHPATAAVLAAADPATRAIILAALQQQQEQEAAVAATEQQQQQQASALAAVQQQQTAFLSAQQQQQHQDLLDTQHRAASAAAFADRQQQQDLMLAQQQAQALLASQQHHLQHMQAAPAPGQAQAASFAAFLAGATPPGLPGTAQHAAGAFAPAYPPAMQPQVPPPSSAFSQLLQAQQLQQPAQAARQLSQALSGYSVGSEPPGGVSMPLPQHPPPARAGEHPVLHAALPAGEPPLRYSPSPAPSRSLDGSAGRRAAAAGSGAAARYQQGSTREHPPAYQTAAGPQTGPGLSAFAGMGQHRPRIKAVVSSGGRFVQPGAGGRLSGVPSGGLSTAAAISAAAPGSWTYAGGETRLVSLPDTCTLLELLAVLSSKKQRASVAGFLSPGAAGAAGGAAAHLGSARGPSPGSAYWSAPGEATPAGPLSIAASTKGSSAERMGGQPGGAGLTSPGSLASAADTLGTSALASAAAAVAAAAEGRASGLQKLCIVRYKLPSEPGLFVDVVDDEDVRLMFEEYADWAAEGSLAGAVGRKLHIFVEWLPQTQAAGASAESADSDLRGTAPGQAHFTPSDSSLEEHSPMEQRLPTKLSDLTSNKIEVIPSGDVQLLAHIGGGTFGDTYRGRWHESDVAVKCINPLMIGVQYASRQAWVDFLRDANQMGKLRHGNLCEVYGVVLPHDSDPRLAAPRSRSEPNAPGAGGSGSAPPAAGEAALAAAPPPPALPAPAESPRQGGGSPPPAGAAMLMQREATLPPVASTLPQLLPGPVANPPTIVMEFVAGRSLGSAIAARSDLISGRLARVVYALDTAKALSYLHSRKVAHLDLKSGNVLLGWRDRRPTAKVAGYGLTGRKVSMVRSAAQGVTSAASMLPWTAPEVLRTPEYVTGKADVYSFAVLMFELWTLKKPFEGQDPMELLGRVVAGEVVRPALPGTGGEPPVQEPGPGWRELLERCWAEDPEQRPDFSVIEEELRGIAREVKRQQGPPRARPAAPAAQAQPPRAASRPALPPGLPRPRSGTNLAAQDAAAGAPAAPEPSGAPQAEGLARPGSGFLIARLPGSGVWAPAAQLLLEDAQLAEATTGQRHQQARRGGAAGGAGSPTPEDAGASGARMQSG